MLLDLIAVEPALVADRPGLVLIADKNYYGRERTAASPDTGIRLLRPARSGEPERACNTAVQAAATTHRVGQPDAQGPARPRTARRADA